MSTIQDLLASKKFTINNIVNMTITKYHIPDTHQNQLILKQKLQNVIKGHGLNSGDTILFDEAQVDTFLREIKPIVEKKNWTTVKHKYQSRTKRSNNDNADSSLNSGLSVSQQDTNVLDKYEALPLNKHVDIHKLYTISQIVEDLAAKNHIKLTPTVEKTYRSGIYARIRYAFITGRLTELPYHSNSLPIVCYYPKETYDYMMNANYIPKSIQKSNHLSVSTHTKSAQDIEIPRPVSKPIMLSDSATKTKQPVNSLETAPINAKQQSSQLQTENSNILNADPFDLDTQIRVLTKRFLMDQYNIDANSWKADQDALQQLDTHSQAYANIHARLLHPEQNYVHKK